MSEREAVQREYDSRVRHFGAAFKTEMLQKLTRGEPIGIGVGPGTGLGDLIYTIHSAREIFEFVCDTFGIPKGNITFVPVDRPAASEAKLSGEFTRDLMLTTIDTFGMIGPIPLMSSLTVSTKYFGALAMGVLSDVSDDFFRRAPVPERFPYGPLATFDMQKVLQRKQEIRERIGDDVITIVRAGSIPEKRFNIPQLQQLVDVAHVTSPSSRIIVISDEQVSDSEKVGGINNALVFVPTDINEMAAYLGVGRKVITTDTSAAWIAAGILAQDTNGILKENTLFVLNTVASPNYYLIPEAVHIKGEAIENVLTSEKSVMSTKDYHDYYQSKLKGLRRLTHMRLGIESQDMDRFIRVLQASLMS